eukprot:TRINITY_DN14462_c0_g1_i1.p1 TRINITY_DN14462_c0_g1~~TRINITY_DN14462_c0_g1_i1.p1  ORF type:complete len:171 (-),score=46.97 TRINITY_DN14462_c0_g1_i1:58-570(-)
MKFLVAASALVAAISASASPQLLYGGLGYAGYPYALGYGLGVKSAPCVNAANIPVPCAGRRKRDADADPALLYGGYAGYPYAAYGVPFASSTGLDPITQGLDASTQGVAPYAAYGYGLGYYGKRDADADPALLYGGYAGYGYAGYPYAYGVTHPANLGLCLNYLGAQVPC